MHNYYVHVELCRQLSSHMQVFIQRTCTKFNVTIKFNIFVTKITWMVLPQVAKQTPPVAETSVADLTSHGDQISSASNPP
jgi:hypothetical protein